jgi:predicted metal-dependent phosphoesterase TrpH
MYKYCEIIRRRFAETNKEGILMLYRYDFHVHTKEASACGVSSAREMVQAYKDVGFAGFVLTNHFIYGNTRIDRKLPWKDWFEKYYDAYVLAKKAGDDIGIDVMFGVEHAYGDGKEMLIYGPDADFWYKNDVRSMTIDQLAANVHAEGGLIYQAHPFRCRGYINMSVGPRLDLIDGVEILNYCNQPEENPPALRLARENGLLMICGSDNHEAGIGIEGHAGLAFDRRISNMEDMISALKSGEGVPIMGDVVGEPTESAVRSVMRG